MRFSLFFILCLAYSSVAFSQTFTITDLRSLSDLMSFEKNKSKDFNDPSYANVDGTPYLKDEFVPGDVFINDTILIEEVPLRYNIYSDQMEFVSAQKQVLVIDDPNKSYAFNLDGELFSIQDYIDRGNMEHGVLQLIVDGDFRLYKKYQIDFKPATKAIGFQDAQPNRFTRQEDQYLLAVDQNAPETFRNHKDLLEKLKAHKPAIEDYAKEQNLKLKSESGLIQLIQYCNN
nr:hypothetical protein [Sunxiuqinia sp.]